MDKEIAYRLIEMTKDFYVRFAESFSDTRQRPWQGWIDLLDVIADDGMQVDRSRAFKVADIGCGNMRFERLLIERIVNVIDVKPAIDALCVDATVQLMDRDPFISDELSGRVALKQVCTDVIDSLSLTGDLSLDGVYRDRDLVVCFALMHHIPLRSWRIALIRSMIDLAAEGGYVVLSFWQFSKDARIHSKALAASALAKDSLQIDLDAKYGDYFLGWQGSTQCFRYCHDFSDDEVNSMIDECLSSAENVSLLSTFYADGSTGDLNRYVVLKKA